MKTSIRLPLKKLARGMILSKSIHDSAGVVLVDKDYPLEDRHIEKLQQTFGVDYVYIYTESTQEEKKDDASSNEYNFKKVSQDIKNQIFQVQSENPLSLKDINESTKFIIENLNSVKFNELTGYALKDELHMHSINVAILSCMLGKWLNFDEQSIQYLTRAALFHDIGKTKISAAIIQKPSKLTSEEFEEIKKIPIYSYKLAKKMLKFMNPVIYNSILMHCEREDASGYPLGLTSQQIHPFAKIIAIADVFEAMTSNRVYRNDKFTPLEVLEIFRKEFIGKLNTQYLMTFIKHMLLYYEGSKIALNDGEIAYIIKTDLNNIASPLIQKLDESFIDLKSQKDLKIIEFIN